MGFAKLIAPALALAGSALAQGGGGGGGSSCSGTLTISSSGDTAALSACPTYSGSVNFATGVAGDIQLNGVRTITQNLNINGATNLSSLSADSLATIGGTFTMERVLQLNSISMPYLSDVNTIIWKYLPQLQGLEFATGISKVASLDIEASALSSLQGITVDTAQQIILANNMNLVNISIPVTDVTTLLSIGSNGPMLSASFPKLTTADTILISNTSNLDLGALKNATGNIVLSGNRFTNISLPKLVSSGGLAILNNNDLNSFSVPVYQTCSNALRFENNTAFDGELSYPALTTVSGAARFFGSFSSINVPQLNMVAGDAVISTTSSNEDLCSGKFQSKPSYVQGSYQCEQPAGSGSNGNNPSATGSMSSSTSKSAANAVVQPGSSAMGLSVALAGLISMLL